MPDDINIEPSPMEPSSTEPSFSPFAKIATHAQHQIEKIFETYLTSKSTYSDEGLKQISHISKNMALLSLTFESEILDNKDIEKISDDIKYLHDHFQSTTLQKESDRLIQNLKNLNPKIDVKIKILQSIIDLEDMLCITNEILTPDELKDKFEKILDFIKITNSSFHLTKLEREINEVKTLVQQSLDNKNHILHLIESISISHQ